MPARIAIFGATSTIAAELAKLYAAKGHQLFLVGRSAPKLQALVASLGSAVVGHAQQDFDATAEAEACVARVVEGLGGIDIAVIAHGLLGDQLESEVSLQVAEQIARTNFLSVMALVIPLANYFEQQAGGQLAVLSTVAADRGRPRNYTYAAAKSALNTYLQGVRSRLYSRGVQVHTIKLGPVDTPMTVDHQKSLLFAKAPAVARGIARAIERGQPEAYVPRFWQPVMFAVRNLPELVFQQVRGLSGR